MLATSFLCDHQAQEPTPMGMTAQIKLIPRMVIDEARISITSSLGIPESGIKAPSMAIKLIQSPIKPGRPHSNVVAITAMILVVFFSM